MRADNPGVYQSSISPYQVCVLCGAIESGNATCWACVDRWSWSPELLDLLIAQRDDSRREFLAMLYAEIATRVFGPGYVGTIDAIRNDDERIEIDHTFDFKLYPLQWMDATSITRTVVL